MSAPAARLGCWLLRLPALEWAIARVRRGECPRDHGRLDYTWVLGWGWCGACRRGYQARGGALPVLGVHLGRAYGWGLHLTLDCYQRSKRGGGTP